MTHIENDPAAAMRAGMRRLAATVSIVCLRGSDGQRHAMTASSVTSLSDDPASLLVCINRSAACYPAFVDGADFSVNILKRTQQDLSVLCAGQGQGDARFARGNWAEEAGTPYLQDAEAAFFCKNVRLVEYGTHIIVIGDICKVHTADGEPDPLIYLNGAYHTIS